MKTGLSTLEITISTLDSCDFSDILFCLGSILWASKPKVGTKQSRAVAQEKMADLNHQRKSGGFDITKPHVFKKFTSWGHWLGESRNIFKYNRVNSNPPFPAWVAAVVKQSSIF